jgi:hypothetical protein
MPIYNFKCGQGCAERKVLTPEQAKGYSALRCAIHDSEWKRSHQPPSTTSMETIDNGLMVKKVETYVGVSDMVSERARLDDPRLSRDNVGTQVGEAEGD